MTIALIAFAAGRSGASEPGIISRKYPIPQDSKTPGSESKQEKSGRSCRQEVEDVCTMVDGGV